MRKISINNIEQEIFKYNTVYQTISGGTTTPFIKAPKLPLTNRGFANQIKKSYQWLIDNCITEAQRRCNNLDTMRFSRMNIKNLSSIDIQIMFRYLFEWEWRIEHAKRDKEQELFKEAV